MGVRPRCQREGEIDLRCGGSGELSGVGERESDKGCELGGMSRLLGCGDLEIGIGEIGIRETVSNE